MMTSWSYPMRRLIGMQPPPAVPVVRLAGIIGAVSPLRPGLTLAGLAPLLERAFRLPGAKAVALSINSPGGSAAQSSLIHTRIRALSAERKLPVLAFVEDVAASGGYWLACAGDEVHADATSILGSIGVVSASFGFPELLNRIGVERRLYTTGPHKAMLDPFRPEQPGDVERLKEIQGDLFESFKALVRERRAGKLKAGEGGAVHRGGLVRPAGAGDGPDRRHRRDAPGLARALRRQGPAGRRRRAAWLALAPPAARDRPGDWAEGALAALEERMLWSRYGL